MSIRVTHNGEDLDYEQRERLRRGGGSTPDIHRASTRKLGFPVYEVRDTSGAAVRGAVILDEGNDPWLVFVAPHDRFHSVAADTLAMRHRDGKLLPSSIDQRLRDEEEAELRERDQQQSLLLALLDALGLMLSSGQDEVLATETVDLPAGSIRVSAVAIPDDGWDVATAHEHDGLFAVCLSLTGLKHNDRSWAIGVLAPFLGPNPDQREEFYDGAADQLTLSVVMTNAELLQLLADRRPTIYEPGSCPLPPPTVLHYADRFAITRAFVNGEAIRTVCGQRFIPRGDASTHANLPLCPDCEAELPAARAIRDMLRGRV